LCRLHWAARLVVTKIVAIVDAHRIYHPVERVCFRANVRIVRQITV
jgi:hypothetical protein